MAQFSSERGVSVSEMYEERVDGDFYVSELVGYRIGIKDSRRYGVRYIEVSADTYEELLADIHDDLAEYEDTVVDEDSLLYIEVLGLDGLVRDFEIPKWVADDLVNRLVR